MERKSKEMILDLAPAAWAPRHVSMDVSTLTTTRRSRPEPEACTRAQVSLDGSADVADLARRYLAPTERQTFESMTGRGRVPWLLGRVAAKVAVRDHLVSREFTAIDPTRIVVANDAFGCPVVQVRGARLATRAVRVSIAHKPEVAVALAATLGLTRWVGDDLEPVGGIGIDIEAVGLRAPTFERTVLTSAERSLSGPAGEGRDTWLTRLWTVKEAVAKATGLGFRGRPTDFEIDAVDGDRLRCRGRWIATECVQAVGRHFIVAWTDTEYDQNEQSVAP